MKNTCNASPPRDRPEAGALRRTLRAKQNFPNTIAAPLVRAISPHFGTRLDLEKILIG
jgi:hypothetical protein